MPLKDYKEEKKKTKRLIRDFSFTAHFDHFALLHSQAASIIERRRHLLRNWESMSSRTPSTADPPTDLGLRYSEGLFSMSRAHRRTTSGETDSDWDYQDDDDDDDDEDANRQMLQEIRGSFTCQRVASRAAILSLESVDANSLSKEERSKFFFSLSFFVLAFDF